MSRFAQITSALFAVFSVVSMFVLSFIDPELGIVLFVTTLFFAVALAIVGSPD